mmetsp:Transcript_2634/g.3881  ORF Transcript_2634/g.3881 Transcript_2634/m.3881 type:complete len:116 (+) Transcript_2634:969-1316(+)
MYSMGLTLVANEKKWAANTLSAMKFPKGVSKEELLPKITKRGVIVAGGLHKKIKTTYFRVGHMGLSVLDGKRQHLVTVIEAIEGALIECGVKIEKGKALTIFKAAMGGYSLKSSL